MSASNNRIKDFETVHHLTSRIAHRVFFLGGEECNDLMNMIRRASQFCGLKLLAWCIMTNHFHLLVYLPVRRTLSDDEVLDRYAILKGAKGREIMEGQLDAWKQQGEVGAKRAQAWFDRQRARMFDIGEFMKIVKQWFSEEYNRRRAHVGTLWESTYHDRLVSSKERGVARCAGYIHLNPIRGAICSGYSEYPWSSFTALAQGDQLALEGMRFVYGEPEATSSELIDWHTPLLDAFLERERRRRAEEIARKRAAGYEIPCDPLTTEAMVAQAAAHRERVLQAGVELAEEEIRYRKCAENRERAEHRIVDLIRGDNTLSPGEIAKQLSIPPPTVYKYLKGLLSRGILLRPARNSPWQISELYV